MNGASRVLWVIMAGVLAWGAFHALGAYLYNHDPRRPLVVLGCVVAFLGWWQWLLSRRAARLRRLAAATRDDAAGPGA